MLGGGATAGGRYDIAVTGPRLMVSARGPVTEIRGGDGVHRSALDPFDLLRLVLGRPISAVGANGRALPFVGGAIGWFGYDLARRFERLPSSAADPLGLPELSLGVYDWALVVDHQDRLAYLVGRGAQGPRSALRGAYRSPVVPIKCVFRSHGDLDTNLDAAAYRAGFQQVQSFITAGDCYQVNLARRFSVAASGDPWSAYLRLGELAPAPFSAYLNHPSAKVLSVSPERFLRLRDGAVETAPIKGTAPRGTTPELDLMLAEALKASAKDRAENLMIVDLLRNDLGRTCVVGSVAVPSLFALASFATVHHLVSTVTGRLSPDHDGLDLLRGAFPGGSITGAPKIRAMQIIESLEGERRGVYCGAIGYLGFDGAMDTSIAIRTGVFKGQRLWFWAGGGLVADSQPDEEAAEILVKARAMLQLVDEAARPEGIRR